MNKESIFGMMLTLLLICMLTLAFDIQQVKASGTIYIRADGSVEPDTAPISSVDNVTYAFTGNIYDEIVVERDNIVVDGAGHIVQGTGSGIGITLSERSNITIKNMEIKAFYFGIILSGSGENSITGNAISNSYVGIFLEYTHLNESTSNIIVGNTISSNEYGIGIEECSGNYIYHNNFINNTIQAGVSLPHMNAWDNGYPSGGNYWSDHVCTGNPSDGSQPYIIDANNRDHYPFQDPNGWLKVHNIYTGLNYTTIQEAIDAPETLDGHTIFVEAGIYCEYVVVNKMIRLIGESQLVTIIDGWFDVEANNVVISGFAVGGFTAFSIGKTMYFGIRLFDATDCRISNNTVFNTGKGIWLWNSTDNVISDNYVTIHDYGIYVDESPNNTIIRNMIEGIESVRISEYGIALWHSPNTKIIENTIFMNYKEGFLMEFSSNTNVIQNTISTSREGIRISHSSNNFISQNNITLNRDYGIRAIQSHNNTIIRNVIANTSTPGEILLKEASPALTLQDSYFNRIIQNNITNNYVGVEVASSALNTVSGNNISSNNYGIRLDYPWTNYNEVSDNIVSNNDYGIFLASSANNNTIFGNHVTNNNRGICLSGTNNNMFFHNNIVDNTQQVVSYDSTNLWDDDYPSGGNFWSDYPGVDANGDGIGDTPYIIDENNTDRYPLMHPWSSLTVHNINTGLGYATIQEAIDAPETLDGHIVFVEAGTYRGGIVVDKPLTLIGENKEITIIDGGFYVVHITASDVYFGGFTVRGGYDGVHIDRSYNNTIINNIVLKNGRYGIVIESSQNNTVINNIVLGFELQTAGIVSSFSNGSLIRGNIASDMIYFGVYLWSSYGNLVSSNTATKNYDGIRLEHHSNDNIVSNNILLNNSVSIMLWDSSNNLIDRNEISKSYWAGVYLNYDSDQNVIVGNGISDSGAGIFIGTMLPNNNKIYHNNFINNTKQVILSDSSYNLWDDGYPSGGNYWSDYTGVDLYGGPYQNETGSDGLGDTPYVIDADNIDRYPLMNHWKPIETNVKVMGKDYPVTIVSNTTIEQIVATKNTLHFKSSGPTGEKGYILVIFPMVNTTEIKVFIDSVKLTPPPFPVINTNETHYFIYFEFTLSTHNIGIQFAPIEYTLAIESSPIEVTFSVDGVPYTTPWSATYDEGTQAILEMPEIYSVREARYYWDQWSDGITSRSRTVTMNTNITLTAYYSGPYYELTVTSSPIAGITFTINGTPQITPYTEWLLEGSYTLVMPETHNGYVWSHWLEDGDTNRIKTITLSGTTWTGVFVPAPPPPAVGGEMILIYQTELSPSPWISPLIAFASLIILATAISVVYFKHRRKQQAYQ